MISLGWFIGTSAMAQTVSGGEIPELNAQRFRPAIDAARTFWLDDARMPLEGAQGRVLLSYHHNPLVYRQGDEETRIVRNVLQANAIGGWGIGPVRLGLDVPIYLLADGEVSDPEAGIGDIGLDGRVTIFGEGAPVDAPVDIGLQGRLFVPTATVNTALGAPDLAGQIAVVASADVGNLLLLANAGTRINPTEVLENIELNDAFEYRFGGAYAFNDRGGISLEFAGLLYYSAEIANRAGSPFEGLVGGYGRLTDNLELRGAIGRGLTAGVGSPDLRIIAGLALLPGSPKTTEEPEPVDSDGDGVVDSKDGCPDEAEDLDTYQDDDGCPDPNTSVAVRVLGPNERPLRRATLTRTPPGEDAEPVVTKGPQHALVLEPGTWTFDVTAPGYKPVTVTQDVVNGPAEVLNVTLEPSSQRIVVDQDRIELAETVQFQTGSDRLLKESLPLLDEIAGILDKTPDIIKVSIEGHTDNRGDEAANQRLSARRAQTVMTYLVNSGIAKERLQSAGFGESKPLDERNVDEAWEKNRRVEIRILEWADDEE
ncbi:MAG: OmpA family protein [Myxococcota bacterium]